MKELLDVLLIARPGRAQRIFEPLLDSGLKFKFVTFKLFPKWLKKLTGSRKMQVKGCSTQSLLIFTLYDFLRFKPYGKWLEKIGERPLFEFFLRKKIYKSDARLIHYWPNYCYKYIAQYKKQHPGVVTFADVYLPCEKFIVDEIAPKLEALGVGMNVEYIRKRADLLDDLMACEDNFICQSEYVANSYRKYYPDKNYFVINNGLSISIKYKPKAPIKEDGVVSDFVYCGKVSVEKGCDLLVEWFSKHPELQINLFGKVETAERKLFSVYESYSNIHFHGSVPKDEMQNIVSKYDAGIHLSRYDAWSIAVGEVIGAGLPVVVSDQTGISELVRIEDFGEICELTEESINKSILRLITPLRYNECIKNIDNYIRSNPKSYGERVVDFYKEHIK
jgi:glycosyltransferase involved in cell wall biosynthesis